MSRVERKVLALLLVFVLSLQIAGIVALNSAMKIVTPVATGGVPGMQDLIVQLIGPFYHLQIVLLFITVFCFFGVTGGVAFLRRLMRRIRAIRSEDKWDGQDAALGLKMGANPEQKDVARVFAVMRDLLVRRENEIKRLAYSDTLTDLPNRSQFISMLSQAIAATDQSNPNKASCFVLIMDLDRFKNVNDVMGHSFGDLLLKEVAQRLRGALPGTQLARLGGDEFALLLPNSNLTVAQDSAKIMLLLLEHPMTIGDQTVDLGAGIGIAGFPEHGDSAEIILSHAELAMYAAKRNLSSNFMVYCPAIDHASQQNLSLISELRDAIKEDQLCLFLQPKFDLKLQRVVGAEALVRWNHPTRGFLAPDKFILFAEQTGTIRLLTKWMLEKSARLSHELNRRGIDLSIAVNVSTHDLLDPELPRKIEEIFQRHHVNSKSFCLEITESAIMNDPQRAQHTLERLSYMGVNLSIDDFGTGYSSLSYLKRLPVNELKIDQSFVLQMIHDGDDRTIVKSTIDLGHNMGLRVTAEGVETQAVMQLLGRMGCDQVQGNAIHKAIPAEQFCEWIEEQLFD